jgi:4-amino-4-deoxy-L-arabinose transferase-like glycosyltransferase
MNRRLEFAARYLPLGLVVAFLGIGSCLVRTSESSSALTWMNIYDPADFIHASFADITSFFRDLRIPIPPIIGLAEIISIKLSGSPILVTRYAYRAALVGSYAAAIWLARTSIKRSVTAFFAAILFLYVTTKVHPGNPQNYDLFFPFFFLLFLLALRRACRNGSHVLMPCLAGFLLSMTELTRPFLIYLLPLLVGGALLALNKGAGKKQFLPFLLPILLISGGWHSYLLAAHGQLTFSNNTGFNVARVWPQIPAVMLVEEPNYAPLAPGRWANLNTAEHGENSRRAQQAQLQYWLAHPVDSLLFAVGRTAELLAGNTAFGGFVPESRWFGVYAMVVRLTSSLMILCTGLLIGEACLHPRKIALLLAQTDNMTLLFTVCCVMLLANGEIREEPRLLLSILPLLAMLPVCRSAQAEPLEVKDIVLHTLW